MPQQYSGSKNRSMFYHATKPWKRATQNITPPRRLKGCYNERVKEQNLKREFTIHTYHPLLNVERSAPFKPHHLLPFFIINDTNTVIKNSKPVILDDKSKTSTAITVINKNKRNRSVWEHPEWDSFIEIEEIVPINQSSFAFPITYGSHVESLKSIESFCSIFETFSLNPCKTLALEYKPTIMPLYRSPTLPISSSSISSLKTSLGINDKDAPETVTKTVTGRAAEIDDIPVFVSLPQIDEDYINVDDKDLTEIQTVEATDPNACIIL